MNKKCQSRKKNRTRCQADAQIGKEFCVFHDPLERVEEGHRARRAGGIKGSQGAAVLSPETPDRLIHLTQNIGNVSLGHSRIALHCGYYLI